jgi:hypothetical protein
MLRSSKPTSPRSNKRSARRKMQWDGVEPHPPPCKRLAVNGRFLSFGPCSWQSRRSRHA